MHTNQNPLLVLGFALVALALLIMSWRTLRAMWVGHGSVATLRKRQLVQAQKDELMYAQAAEYYSSLATGARATVDRLTIPVGLDDTAATLASATKVVNVINRVAPYIPPTAPETYAKADDFSDVPHPPKR